ncbi:MAG: hypothetical protein QM773_07815 [Hyphomonadaceae bacterium]
MRATTAFVSFTAFALAACATPPPAEPPAGPIVGGYGVSNPEDESVKAAQKLAVDEIYKRNPTRALVEKVTAETQVVAGLNYRFTIAMSGGATYRVVVFRDLLGAMSVTSYEKVA